MNATQLDQRQRAALLDRLYQRISDLDDASLAQLEVLTAAPENIEQPDDEESGGFSRRAFIAMLLLGGSAATVGGGAAAFLLNQQWQASGHEEVLPTTAPPIATEQPAPTAIPPTPGLPLEVSQQIFDLQAQLGEANADRLALRTQLDAARTEVDTLTTEVSTLTTDLATSESEVQFLQQMVAIYEQLEAVGLDDIIQAGMTPLAAAILALQTGRDLLEAGVQDAAARLATIEVQSPEIANGLLWLETQIETLARRLQDVEDALSNFVEPVAPLAMQVGDFFGQLLDMLPFGMGESIRAALDAIAALLTHIPELVASVNPMIITPLRQWVSPVEGEGLVANVVQPISSNLVNPAQQVASSTTALETAYNTRFKTPVELALAARAEIRVRLPAPTATPEGVG